jgi:UDP-N-acetylglucosamine 2-epimerase (non-hydrolysing)
MSAYQEGGALPNLVFTEPMGYLDFMKLVSHSRLVLTDSGGVQEETTFLGVPCLTMRENTERPVTISAGTNRLVGLDPGRIVSEGQRVLGSPRAKGQVPELWDGCTAGRILDILTGKHPGGRPE